MKAMERAGLTAQALAVGYHGKPLFSGIDLHLAPGTLTALLGVNGIGKSTLLRTLAGLQRALGGTVEIGGRPVAGMSAAERARHVAMVLTGRPRAGMLDVRTLVGLGRQPWTGPWGKLAPQDHELVHRAMEQAGVAHLAKRALATCSDGECQKALIARALAQQTPVILLDEPTAFLDLPNRAALVRVLRQSASEAGRTVLFSSHDLQLALDMCDALLLLRSDGALWHGSPQEAIKSGELERAFAGSGVSFDPVQGTHRFRP